MAETNPDRTPIYLDVDDDITAIVKKISDSDEKTISLVTPKRSSVMQSVVNQKLIKKAASGANKDIAIITEDNKVKTIAGGLGLATAPNLRTEPVVAEVDKGESTAMPSDVIEDPSPVTGKSEAPLAKGAAAGAAAVKINDGSNGPINSAADSTGTSSKAQAGKGKKIPDFGRFKKKTIIGIAIAVGLLLLLFILWYYVPSAKVVISGRTESQPLNFEMTVDTQAEEPNYEQQVLPGVKHDLNKTLTATFKATGKKDAGTKATGTVSVKNCEDSDPRALSSGTGFTASNGKVFVSTSPATVPGGSFSGGGATCKSDSINIPVSASTTGESFNIDSTAYSSGSLTGKFVITGSQMTGGSSKTVSVVTQSDVDNAKNQLIASEQSKSKSELDKQFSSDQYILAGSLTQTVGEVTSSPVVGGEGENGSVNVKVAYSEYGVDKQQMNELLDRQAKTASQKDGSNNLGVVNNGLGQAKFTPTTKVTDAVQKFNVKSSATLGPDINFVALQSELKGKGYSASLDKIKSYPNVTDAQIKFSPFYVNRMPRRSGNIHITIDVPEDQQ